MLESGYATRYDKSATSARDESEDSTDAVVVAVADGAAADGDVDGSCSFAVDAGTLAGRV